MARDIRDYLDIGRDAAADQWRRIDRRRPAAPGRRQENFEPVEVLLCFGLFRVVSPHRFGGANIDRVPEDVKALAHTFRRPAGSLLSKMLNLDNSRENAGSFEVELFVRLSADPGLYAALYRTVLAAARTAGLGGDRVPDFLGLLDAGAGPDLLGQDEIGARELEQALRETAEERAGLLERTGVADADTERVVEARIRMGQHRFARSVLADYGHRCGFCGFAPGPIEGGRLLVASHIKPWRASDPRKRLDRRNGIAACPAHDAAFDTGLLTVNGGRRIRRATELETLAVRDPAASRFFGDGALAAALLLPAGAPGPGPRYLEYHRAHVFRSN